LEVETKGGLVLRRALVSPEVGVDGKDGRNGVERTIGPGVLWTPFASPSQATIREMSCINDLTSRAGVLLDRSWLSLASRHGCWETWTLEGRSAMAMGVVY